MTNYLVELTDQAQSEAEDAYFRFSARTGPDFAAYWFDAIRFAMQDRLSFMPQRFPLSPEGDAVYPGAGTRQMLFGENTMAYRIIFHIIEPEGDDSEGVVRVLRIRHAAMRPLGQAKPSEDEA